MKAIKILLKVVVAIIALVVVALLALPLWFGPVVKTVANSTVPKVVKTDFHLGHLYLNPYTARFELRDMQLANPAGYSEKYAVTLGDITFDAETLSLATDVIHIEEITVKDIFVSVVSGGENKVGNFKQLQYNVAGGKEKYEAAQAEKEDKAKLAELQAKETAQEKREPEPQTAEEEKPAKKVIIDKLHISGLKVQLGFLPLALPATIELTDIGRETGGATLAEAWQQIWTGILKAAGIAGDQLKALGNLTGNAAKQVTEAAGKAAAQATELVGNVAGQATEAVGNAAGAVGNVAGQATEAVGNAAGAVGNVVGQATGAVGNAAGAVGNAAGWATEAVGNAAGAVGNAAGDAVNKAGEAAGKALDSLKSLW